MIRTFTINTRPYYDQINQCYLNILTCNIEPQGPIRKYVRKLTLPKLSPFQVEGPCNPLNNCALALTRLDGNCGCSDLLTPNEIPDLISFLLGNGYQIETQLTNMMNGSNVKQTNKRLVMLVTYYGINQPTITYMR